MTSSLRNKEAKKCRLCRSKSLKKLLDFGNQYVNYFPDEFPYDGLQCPLRLVQCADCSLVQLSHTAPQEIVYSRHYWYESGINEVIVDDLREIAQLAVKMGGLKKGDILCDIGANDGTLLSFLPKGIKRWAIEPALNLQEKLRENADRHWSSFWEDWNYSDKFSRRVKIKAITAIGMFYDSEDPSKFIRNVSKYLDKNGIFIAQLMTLKPMLDNADLGNICHEHLEYYSYESLVYLFEQNGLEIFKLEENKINGGSYRIFARHFDKGSIEHPEDITGVDIMKFFNALQDGKWRTLNFLRRAKAQGKKVYAYGASTKGNTILQYYGIDSSLITGVADKNPEKHGKFMLTGIPIVSEEEARREADYFFVLPYAFIDTFVKREKDWIKKGGQFVVSIPEFKII